MNIYVFPNGIGRLTVFLSHNEQQSSSSKLKERREQRIKREFIFYLFKAKDGRTVHVVNKLQINSYFSALNNSQGESEYQVANKDLSLLKKVCNELAAHIDAGNPVYRGAILGGCNQNKSLKNRLINDV